MWTCQCGAANVTQAKACEICGDERFTKPPAVAGKACDACGEAVVLWTQLTRAEDGVQRCARCHLGYLIRREDADRAAGARCTEPGCTKTAAEHIAEGKAIMASAAWAVRFRSQR